MERAITRLFDITLGSSVRTSLLGIAAGIALLLPEISKLLDGDASTELSYETVTAALALMGIGRATRDNSITSERAGAK